MSVETYWKGEGIRLDRLWRDFDEGAGYRDKVASTRLHMLRLTFSGHPPELPLFDFEVVYKTVKGTFHDLKRRSLTRQEYDESAPIFLHRVERGSGVFEFLAELLPLVVWIGGLGIAADSWYRKRRADNLAYREKSFAYDTARLEFIQKNFPNATRAEIQAFLRARATTSVQRALERLVAEHLGRVEVSAEPHQPQEPPRMVDMLRIVPLDNLDGDA